LGGGVFSVAIKVKTTASGVKEAVRGGGGVSRGGFKRLLTAGRHSSLAPGAPDGRPRSRFQASCYGDFFREQMRGLNNLLRQ
jgi:hypothetical protein